MDTALIKLSIERLLEKVEFLERENIKLKERIQLVENRKELKSNEIEVVQEQEDILIDTKEVLHILGISYNTLRAIVRKNLILPIRINQRRVRYSKKAIKEYIKSRTTRIT
jgi:predicted DNA-binding transcriptional regulator AlpA